MSQSALGMSRATGGGRGNVPQRPPTPPAAPGSASNRHAIHLTSLVLLAVIFLVMYELFPHLTKWVVFDLFLRNVWYWGPWAALALLVLRYNKRNNVLGQAIKGGVSLGAHRRSIAVLATLATVFILWNTFVYFGSDLMTYHAYASKFAPREGFVPSAPGFVRFTPLKNACTDLGNSVSATGEHVECDYVQPMLTDHGFGYVAPITLSGLWNSWFNKNPGFLVLDDSAVADATPGKRLFRIDEPQYYGKGMEWFDGLDYQLAKTSFFSDFDTPHFLALDPAQPQKLTLIVPKIRYGFFFRLPYWGGDVLVHSDGVIEDLSAEEVGKDKRLAGKWVYPMSLARTYVNLQNYAAGEGLLTPFVRAAGLLDIEQLNGDNQFPFLTQGSDNKTYLVTATKGQGSARGLFRMYYVDASTGVGSYHQFGSNEVIYGAGAALQRMSNIQGYQWADDKGNGVAVAIEPVYIVRPHDGTLYWKYTITNVNHMGISATAVSNSSRPDEIRVFQKRGDFEAWMTGAEPATTAVSMTNKGGNSREQILRILSDMAREMELLRKQVETLP